MSNFKITGGTFNQSVFGDNATQNAPVSNVTERDAAIEAHLQSLQQLVIALTRHLPAADATRVEDDFEQLKKQAKSDAPRKRWYEVSAEGLVAAAKSVAEIGGPLSTSLAALSKLLFP